MSHSRLATACGAILILIWAAGVVGSSAQSPSNPIHGLVELSERTRLKPCQLLKNAAGEFPSERVIFKDTQTGASVWKMSRNPGFSRHDYSNMPCWNLDGSELSLSSTRSGEGRRLWLVSANGDLWRPALPETGQWSRTDAHLFYTWDDELGLRKVDVRTGEATLIFKGPIKGGFLIPPSMDGKKLLVIENYHGRAGRQNSAVWQINSDGNGVPQRFDLGAVVHQTWLLKRPGYAFTFNDEKINGMRQRGQMFFEPPNLLRPLSDVALSHLSVSPDGQRLAHQNIGRSTGVGTGIVVLDVATGQSRLAMPGTGHGHIAWECDDRWLVKTTDNSLDVLWVDEGRSETLCIPNSQLGYSSYYTEVDPECSPDGTKVGYCSSMLGDGDFYIVIRQYPDPPRKVKREEKQISWEAPEHAQELAGYQVYRDGILQNEEPLQARTFATKESGGTYEVAAIDHSGLESRRADSVPPPAPPQLEASVLDPYTVKLTWLPPPPKSGISHYNVYCGIDAVKVEQARLISSPSASTTVDWGLRAGREYHYLVTAVDSVGNESAPSLEAVAHTPSVEVEQQHIAVGQVLGKPASVRFNIVRQDEYVIWIELAAGPARRSLPLNLSLDGVPQTWTPLYDLVSEAHAGPLPGVAFFEPLPAMGGDLRHALSAGEHTLTFQPAKGSPVLRSVTITNDGGFTPAGVTSFLAAKPSKLLPSAHH